MTVTVEFPDTLPCVSRIDGFGMALSAAVLRTPTAAGNAQQLRLAAHTLKGSANMFAAGRLAQVATELENMGRDGRMEQAASTCARADHELKMLISVLQAEA